MPDPIVRPRVEHPIVRIIEYLRSSEIAQGRFDPLETLRKVQSFLAFGDNPSVGFATNRSPGRSGFLGLFLGFVVGSNYRYILSSPLSAYAFVLGLFHSSEFCTTALFNGSVCTSTSFLVDHSVSYSAAFFFSLFEYGLRFLFSSTSPASMTPLRFLGLVSSLSFLSLRSYAMSHCGNNFNHIIQSTSNNANPSQKLVTTGPYKYLRHPAYTAWFYYTLSTQVLLGNRLCLVAYAVASWKFFKERIPYEEGTLRERFEGYDEYRARTWVLIPGIEGGKSGGDKKEA